MERYLGMGVEEVIEAFPQVGEVLASYGVGCADCALGTCTLADVVQVHALAPAEQARMMAEIEQVLYPDRRPAQSPRCAAEPVSPREISYSPPVRKLVEEHTWIKRLLALIPPLTDEMKATGRVDTELVCQTLGFIRGYADRFHHMKEEEILFDYTERGAEIIRVMYGDHDLARGLVRAAAQAVEQNDPSAACVDMTAYRELLVEHIRKEDEVLYPYIDRGLSTHQVGEIYRRFEEAESRVGDGVPGKYERFIIALEWRY